MRKVGIQFLGNLSIWERLSCLLITAVCGILVACLLAVLVAFWAIQSWESPSKETRIRVESAMRACLPAESTATLPDGWRRGATYPYPPYNKFTPPGAIGSISTIFSQQRSDGKDGAVHKLRFYGTTYQAIYNYKLSRIAFTSRWYPVLEPLDLTEVNLSADEYRAACSYFVPDQGPRRDDRACEVQTRHGRLTSELRTDVSPQGLSLEDMIRLLEALDEQMERCVESVVERRWEEE